MSKSRHKNIRLQDWDYSNSAMYMVTVCVQDRVHRLGDIDASGMLMPSLAGRMVVEEIERLPLTFPHVEVDTFVVMPNHVHALLGLNLDLKATNPVSLSKVIGAFNSRTTVRYINGVKGGFVPEFNKRFWQPGYYETIIRNERMAEEYRHYILNNPASWQEDLEMYLVPESTTRVDAT